MSVKPCSTLQLWMLQCQCHWHRSIHTCRLQGWQNLCSNSTQWSFTIVQIHKSHNAHVPYPTIHHFGTEMCAFLFQSGALWDMGQMHCGICEIGLFVRLVYSMQFSFTIQLQMAWLSHPNLSIGMWSSKHPCVIPSTCYKSHLDLVELRPKCVQ